MWGQAHVAEMERANLSLALKEAEHRIREMQSQFRQEEESHSRTRQQLERALAEIHELQVQSASLKDVAAVLLQWDDSLQRLESALELFASSENAVVGSTAEEAWENSVIYSLSSNGLQTLRLVRNGIRSLDQARAKIHSPSLSRHPQLQTLYTELETQRRVESTQVNALHGHIKDLERALRERDDVIKSQQLQLSMLRQETLKEDFAHEAHAHIRHLEEQLRERNAVIKSQALTIQKMSFSSHTTLDGSENGNFKDIETLDSMRTRVIAMQEHMDAREEAIAHLRKAVVDLKNIVETSARGDSVEVGGWRQVIGVLEMELNERDALTSSQREAIAVLRHESLSVWNFFKCENF